MTATRHVYDPEANFLPEGTVYVGNGTPYANPWRMTPAGNVTHIKYRGVVIKNMGDAVDVFRAWVLGNVPIADEALRVEISRPAIHIRKQLKYLAGRDLGCNCAEGEKCHADVLIELTQKVK